MMLAADSCGAAHPAQLLADSLTALKRLGVTERSVFDRILRSTLERHTGYLGFWSVWEPNALDGRDQEWVNCQGHDDTGRYIPFWNRSHGQINLEPNVFYETPGVGDFYLRPRRERRETVIEPYEYPVAGERRLIATQGAPIVVDGRCVGVAGFDIAVEDIPAAAPSDSENPLEAVIGGSCLFLRPGSSAGKLAYCSSRSRRLLERYVGPMRRDELPAVLQRALETRSTRGNERAALEFRRLGRELQVHPFEHAATGPGLWLFERTVAAPAHELSARESEVLDWLSAGKTNAEIGTILGISVHTVKRHVEKVFQKLEVPNRAAATARAIDRTGLGAVS
jgi:DNA-binding CsgD family transcriptional regulator